MIKHLSDNELKKLIPDMKGQIKFRLMMNHLMAMEKNVISNQSSLKFQKF